MGQRGGKKKAPSIQEKIENIKKEMSAIKDDIGKLEAEYMEKEKELKGLELENLTTCMDRHGKSVDDVISLICKADTDREPGDTLGIVDAGEA